MAHWRRPLAAAVALNTVIFVVEGIAGLEVNGLSLVMDGVPDLGDVQVSLAPVVCGVPVMSNRRDTASDPG
jgi:Co/Zn/Cd efflux system component